MFERASKGQTILEMVLVTFWLMSFFASMYLVATVFEVGQKQTMLLRTQAFIELGNFSYFGSTSHGEDKVDKEDSQVTFALGEKAGGVKIDIEKIKEFHDATSGDLDLNLTASMERDKFWDTYQFPKSTTRIFWLQGDERADPLLVLGPQQVLHIAHNRSIDLNRAMSESEIMDTGLFSGSMSFQDYARLSNFKPPVAEGVEDNIDSVKDVIRQLVKNDPSLADEAKALEGDMNIFESISGGAQGALVSMAIAAVVQLGLDAVMNSIGSELASGATNTGASQAGSGGNYFSNLFKQYAQPYQAASGFMGENLLSGFFDALTAPIRIPVQGFGNLFSGLSDMATADAGAISASITSQSGGFVPSAAAASQMAADQAFQGFMNVSQGLSQIGQGVQMVGSFAGMDMATLRGVGIATSVAGLPSAINAGLEKIDSGMNYSDSLASTQNDAVGEAVAQFGSGVNLSEVMSGVQQITTSVTGVLAQISPELAMPASYVNMAVGTAAGLSNIPTGLNRVLSGETLGQTLKAAGSFTQNLGSVYSNVATMMGEDATGGQLMMLAGGITNMAGNGITTLQNLKVKFGEVNTALFIKETVAGNISNLQNSMQNFGDTMKNNLAMIDAGLKDLTGSNPLKDNAQAQVLIGTMAKMSQMTTSKFSNDRVGVALSNVNLVRAQNFASKLSDNLALNFQLAGAKGGSFAEVFGSQEMADQVVARLEKLASMAPALEAAKGNLLAFSNGEFGLDEAPFMSDEMVALLSQESEIMQAKVSLETIRMAQENPGSISSSDLSDALVAGLSTAQNSAFGEMQQAINMMGRIRSGELKQTEANSAQILAVLNRGTAAAGEINAQLVHEFKTSDGKYSEFSDATLQQRQIKGMMAGGAQADLAANLAANGNSYEDARRLEKEVNAREAFSGISARTQGVGRSVEVYEKELERAYELLSESQAPTKESPGKGPDGKPLPAPPESPEEQMSRALKVAQLAESIPAYSPIYTSDVGYLKEGVGKSKEFLEATIQSKIDNGTWAQLDKSTQQRLTYAVYRLEAVQSDYYRTPEGEVSNRFMTPREVFHNIESEVRDREAKYQRIKSALEACIAGKCPDKNTN